MIHNVLYYCRFHSLDIRCLASNEVDYVLVEIYEGVYVNNLGASHKVARHWYYWLTMFKNVINKVKKCDKC